MSVIVKDMRMPDTCEECQVSCEVGSDLYCQVTDDGNKWGWKKSENGFESRPDWCPLRPLPEKHGRLKDVDAIIEDISKNSESYFADDFAHEWIERQPTIVEAEA